MKNKLNKKEIILFFTILLFIASQIIPNQVNNLDEIWNFNFANCMANGLIPYKDFNMIQSPLLPAICSIFLNIFGKEMLVMRILAIILDTTILFMVYKIMTKLKIKDYLNYITLIILAIIMRPYFTIDYNWASLLIILVILYLELEENKLKANLKKDLLIGIIAGITITLKQTTGLIIVIATVCYKILLIKNKEDFKQYIKIAITRLIGSSIVILLMILYLGINSAINDYIDYCILGITTFSNKISYINRLIKNSNILIRILSILPIIYIVLFYIFIIKKNKQILTLLTFSVSTFIFVYPISDESHFVIAIVPTLISFIYLINIITLKINPPKKEEIIITCFLESFILVIALVFFADGIYRYKDQNINLELNHFKYLPISTNSINSIKEIDEYIMSQQEKVIILDATAALYMIPIDRYNKNYDLFLKGNLGSKGEEGQIESLKNLQNVKILIMNSNYQRNWQNPEKVRKYIQTDMKKIGEIGIFDIYEKNN